MTARLNCPPTRRRNRARVSGSLREIAERTGRSKSELHETLAYLSALETHPELSTMKKKRAIATARRLQNRGTKKPAVEADKKGATMFGKSKPTLVRLEMATILAGMTAEEIEQDRELQGAIVGMYNDAPMYSRERIEELINKREGVSDAAA